MKNVIIVILVVLLAGLGFYVLKKEGITSVEQLTAKVEQTVEQTVNTVKSKVEETLPVSTENVPVAMASLPSDTVVSFLFPAKAIVPAITHVTAFIEKVKTSSLGKKLEIDKMIAQGFEAAQGGSNPMAAPDPFGQDFGNENYGNGESGLNGAFPGAEENSDFGAMPPTSNQPSLEEILKVVNNFENLEFQVRAKTLDGKATPLIKVNASFKDDSYGKQLQETLDGFVEMSKGGPGPELKKDEKDPLTYTVNVKPPMAPVEVLARVKAGGKDLSATIGMIAGPVGPNATKTAENKADPIIAQSAVSKDAIATYVNFNNLHSLIDVVASIAPGETEKQQVESVRKAINSSIGNYTAISASTIFQNGLNAKNCSKFAEDGKAFAPFKAALDASSSNKSDFYKLIGPRTTFAARFDGKFATAAIKIISDMLTNGVDFGNALNPEISGANTEVANQLKSVEEKIAKLKITDVGLVANAPTVSFVPDVGLYLQTEEGVTIDNVAATLQTLFKELAPPSIAETSPITVSKNAKGETQIVIPGAEGYQLTLQSISPTQIFGSIQETFTEEAKGLLNAKESYLNDSKLESKGVKLKITDNHNFYYISTSSLMPLVRQFAPFLTMSKPELKINDAELTQFMDLFDFNLLITGKNSSPENLVLCSAGQAAVY